MPESSQENVTESYQWIFLLIFSYLLGIIYHRLLEWIRNIFDKGFKKCYIKLWFPTILRRNYYKAIEKANKKVYNVDENLVAGAMVFDMATDDTVTDESALGIVHSVTKALTPDLIEAYKVVIFRNNYYYDYFVSDEDVINKCILNSDGSMKIANGDVIRYEYDNLNNISVIELDYDASKKELIHKNSNQMYLCYYYGGVYSIGGGTITMIRASADGTALDIGHQRYAFSVPATVTIHDSKTGEITLGTADDLETYLQVGDECTRIMVVTDELTMRNCIVFR
jgi:hypothetical protein